LRRLYLASVVEHVEAQLDEYRPATGPAMFCSPFFPGTAGAFPEHASRRGRGWV